MAQRKSHRGARPAHPIYTVELDLRVTYDPPIDENGPPIVLTRTFQLPFAPANGTTLYSSKWDANPEPMGFKLSDVVWDVERGVFLAQTGINAMEEAIAGIPRELMQHVLRGWRFGSARDPYEREEANPPPDAPTELRVDPFEDLDDDSLYELHTRPPEQRPDGFNEFFRAMVRHLASGHGDTVRTAYAMDKTGVYLGPQPARYSGPSVKVSRAAQREWDARCSEFDAMDFDAVYDWKEGLSARLPTVAEVVMKLSKSGGGRSV